MRILVTGGAGFIGSNFVHFWHKKYPKDEIVILDNLTYAGHLVNLRDILKDDEISFVKADICDEYAVKSSMERTDVVVHFAAESHVDRSITSSAEFVRTNVLGTQVLLDSALTNKVKLFHHVSTDEVFGSLPHRVKLRFDENSRYLPNSPYSASKAASDHLVRAYHETYGLPVTITNTSNNYGPYQDPEKLVSRFTTNLLKDLSVPLMGKGDNIRDWIHVTDHCRAIDSVIQAALDDPRIVGETFCVGGNSERSNLQVTKEIIRILGKNETFIRSVPDRLGHDKRYAIDSSKIKSILGWEPKYTFERGLSETIDWYKNNEWWWKPLKEGRPIVDPEVQKGFRYKEK